MYELKTQGHFDSAHFLSAYHGSCENLHGHRWRVIASICSDTLQSTGDMKDMVVDFSEFKARVRELCAALDHRFIVEEGTLAETTLRCLRDEGFDVLIVPWRTTAENFARYLFEQLRAAGYEPSSVEVYETPDNCAIYHA